MKNDELAELYDQVQTFEIKSASPASGCPSAGNDIKAVLDILGDLILIVKSKEGK